MHALLAAILVFAAFSSPWALTILTVIEGVSVTRTVSHGSHGGERFFASRCYLSLSQKQQRKVFKLFTKHIQTTFTGPIYKICSNNVSSARLFHPSLMFLEADVTCVKIAHKMSELSSASMVSI